MADDARRQARSVKELLYDDPSRFSFLQAARLMEDIERLEGNGKHCPPGEAVHQEHEIVFFRHKIRLDNPPADVESLQPGGDGQPAVMTVNVMGLAGLFGPLPQTVTEAILERMRYGYRGFPAFLDIFNHRLVSLLYRARKKYRPALDPRGPHEGRVANVLYAFMGLGTPHLRGRVLRRPPPPEPVTGPAYPAYRTLRDAPSDRALLAYAGLTLERYRSPAGLERILAHFFGVKAAVVPFIGAWEKIEEDDVTAIGVRSGRNQILGDSALLGGRVWNQAARFEVRIGPLDLSRFRSFLPSQRDAFQPLVSLIRFYAREELGFFIRLVLGRDQIPALHIGRAFGAYLGHTTWIPFRKPQGYDNQVRLVGRA